MSTESALFMRLDPPVESTIDVLHTLLNAGWTVNLEEQIMFLRLGNADFDWEIVPAKKSSEVFSELEQKRVAGEYLGIILVWEDTETGGGFVIYPDGRLMITLSVNLKRLDCGVTDVSWYLERIVPALSEAGYISSFEWTETP